jgi:hypothetical protein
MLGELKAKELEVLTWKLHQNLMRQHQKMMTCLFK